MRIINLLSRKEKKRTQGVNRKILLILILLRKISYTAITTTTNGSKCTFKVVFLLFFLFLFFYESFLSLSVSWLLGTGDVGERFS